VRTAGRPGGESELAVSLAPAEASDPDLPTATEASNDDDDVVRTTNRTRPSNVVLLLAAILVATLANMVVAWLVLGSTTQVRDQYTIANGLQRCLIRAQISENSATDPNGTAYKAAVTACINK
jgi:hypothetical protein